MTSKTDSSNWRKASKKATPQKTETIQTTALVLAKSTLDNNTLLSVLGDANRFAIKPNEHMQRERRSIGITCCRFTNNRPEALMVCKRYTYAYAMFVQGKYNANNNSEILSWLNQMTVEEKHDLLSLNFSQIWYRVWLDNTTRTVNYFSSKNKFESTFVADNGSRLKKLIAKSTHGSKIWEIPKGRKKNKTESDIHCAIREFQEETRISKGSYKLWPDAINTYSYVDDGITYTNKYYLAYTKHNIEPRIEFGSKEQLEEISDIKWMDIEEIRRIDDTGRLASFIKPIFSFMRKHARK